MAESEHSQIGKKKRVLVNRLDAVGWGVFFIWIGIAFLIDVGWGVGVFGVGVIALGTQAARKYVGLPVELFGLVMGIVLVLWGAWESLNISLGKASIPGGLLPILFIVVGVILIGSAFLRSPRS